MDRRYSKLKEELMDLFGTISVEELIANRPLSNLFEEITYYLSDFTTLKNLNKGRSL